MKKQATIFLISTLLPLIALAQWVPHTTGFSTPFGLWDLSIADSSTVWGIAQDGDGNAVPKFTKNTNGGAQFTVGGFPADYAWSNISALDANTAWIAAVTTATGTGGGIFKTTDGGTTWTQQGMDTIFNATSYCDFVYFWNADEGVAVGDPNPDEFEIYTTTDGGTHWIPVPGSFIPDRNEGEYGVYKNFYNPRQRHLVRDHPRQNLSLRRPGLDLVGVQSRHSNGRP